MGRDPTISAFVTEWQHTDPLRPAGAAFYGSVVAAAIVLAVGAWRSRRADLGSVLWLGIRAGLGAWALRGVAWCGIGAVPVILGTAGPADDGTNGPVRVSCGARRGARRRVTTGALTILALTLAVTVALALPVDRRLTNAPAGLAAVVKSIASRQLGLRVFDAERWGSWLEQRGPDASHFADSRIELIPTSAWRDCVAVSEAQSGWEAILARWQVDATVLSSGDQPRLVAAIDSSAAWRVVHRDADGLVAVTA